MKEKHIFILTALLAGSLALVQAQDGGTVVQGNNLAEKLEWLGIFSQSNTGYVIELNADENRGGSFTYGGKNNVTVTIRGIDQNRAIKGVLRVGSSTILILDNNITVQGTVQVSSGGSLIMNNGSTITGNSDNSGVSVGEKGIFTMNGGEISGNKAEYGGGVYVNSNATFTMIGGIISNNTAYESGGGIYVAPNGTFTMNGGTISGNAASSRYSAENGGGVRVVGAFTMNGGTISGNTAGFGSGVYLTTGTFTMNGGEISGNTGAGNNPRGGGVCVDNKGTFTMNDGNISSNKSQLGGGVSLRNEGTLIMKKGTISNNTAIWGGGVIVGVDFGQATFTISGGTIFGNTSSNAGGGVYVSAGQGIFTKTGGTIYGFDESDTINSNVVKNNSNETLKFRGHAVYAGSADTLLKIREGTAGPGNNMAFNSTTRPPTASGAWDN